MKKALLAIAVALIASVSVSAQSRALGARLGYGVEVSYQHYLGDNFIEGDLGFAGFKGLNIAAAYNITIAQPKWTSQGEWTFYAGPAAGFNWDFPSNNNAGGFGFGIGGNVGLEYVFNIPLQLSIDWRPLLGPYFKDGINYWTSGLFGGGIAVRYFF